MKGLLITNKYLVSEKFEILKKGFIDAGKSFDVYLDYKNNQEAYNLLYEKKPYDFILFYDKDIKLAKLLEGMGYRLFNNSNAIFICDDKYLTYMSLGNDILQPKTISSPFIYYGSIGNDNEYICKCEKMFGYPMIVKECYGSFGFQVYKINSRNELIDCLNKIGNKPFIVQEYISTSFGRDIRVQVIGDKVICAIQRVNKNGDFRANITNGAEAYEYNLNETQICMAIKAIKKLGLDFAGVDLLFGNNNEPILCEVNSNAHIENISKICNVNVYERIIEYIAKEISK